MPANPRQQREQRERTSYRQRAESHKSGFDSTSLKLPDGVNLFSVDKAGVKRVDLLSYRVGTRNPYAKEGTLHPELTYFTHRGIGADSNTFVCPKKTAGKRCPVCEDRRRMLNDKDGDEDLIKDLAPKERQLWVVKDHEAPDRGFQVWDISFHLFGKKLDAAVKNSDEEDGYEFFADNQDGLTLKIGFGEKSFGSNTFYEAETIDFKPRKENYAKDVADELPCLDDLLIILPYEKLKAIYLQTEGDEPDESEAEERPTRRKKPQTEEEDDDDWTAKGMAADEDDDPPPKKPAGKKPRPAPADDDDDDAPPPKKANPGKKPNAKEDDWDEEFEDGPPKKPAGKAKPASADDDEDWDDEPPPKKPAAKARPAADDDEDDAPPPKKPAAGKKPAKPADDDDWDD